MVLGFRVISSDRIVAYPCYGATTRNRLQEHFGKDRIWWYDSNDDSTFYFLASGLGDNFVEEGDHLIHNETQDTLHVCRAKDFKAEFIPITGL